MELEYPRLQRLRGLGVRVPESALLKLENRDPGVRDGRNLVFENQV